MMGVSLAVLQRGMANYRRPSRPTPAQHAVDSVLAELTRKPSCQIPRRVEQAH